MVSNLPNPISVTDFYLAAVLRQLEEIAGEIALLKIAMQSQNPPKISVTVDSAKLVEHLQDRLNKMETKVLKSK